MSNKDNIVLSGKEQQTISVTDIISEGPIKGLVEGVASVYLNDDSQIDNRYSAKALADTELTLTFTNGSNTATLSQANAFSVPEGDFTKYIAVRSLHVEFGSITYTAKKKDFFTPSNQSAWNALDKTGFVSENPLTIETYVPVRFVRPNPAIGSVKVYNARIWKLTGFNSLSRVQFKEGIFDGTTWTTQNHFTPSRKMGNSGTYSSENVYMHIDKLVKIASVSGTTVTLVDNWDRPSGTFSFDDLGVDFTSSSNDILDQNEKAKNQGTSVQFRPGTLTQSTLFSQGADSSAISTNLNLPLLQATGYGSGTANPTELEGLSSAGYNLSTTQIQGVSRIKTRINYAGGFYGINGDGNERETFIRYKFEIAFKREGETSFGDAEFEQQYTHQGKHKNAATFEVIHNLAPFRPFDDFQVKITRLDSDEDPGYRWLGSTHHDWTNVTRAAVSGTTSIFEDHLNYPLTAIAKVGYSSRYFQDLPTRTYHTRGMLVKVPSNYVTREERLSNEAKYTRTSTGSVSTSEQDWDGTFREDVYTNNPAWIYYDMLTNNRYGLGDFISELDIDKYALYRIGRYCDELVDDGKGGQEPRYTLNVYMTKQMDAIKVLKDLATNFLTMLYYLDGNLVPVQDTPGRPIYAFSKSNVIDGQFTYESTGNKTRINQSIVKWNNPLNNYRTESLIVEDNVNIAKTGKVLSNTCVAYGCTSLGQATRYGKWKLWTANNQQEIVSFSTGINGSYIRPGDVIKVQDADRHQERFSGRISSTGTLSTTVIPLDDNVVLAGQSTYELSVVIPESGAYALEAFSTTSDTGVAKSYEVGDLVTEAWVQGTGEGTGAVSYQALDTKEKVTNARASALTSEKVLLEWKENFRVETVPVNFSSNSQSVTNSLSLSTPLQAVPDRSGMWVLTRLTGPATFEQSSKDYRVLSVAQSSKNEYDITAVEYYDRKYEEIESGLLTPNISVTNPDYLNGTVTEVPPPENITIETLTTGSADGDDFKLSWVPPKAAGIDIKDPSTGFTVSTEAIDAYFKHIAHFEITHDFPGPHDRLLKVKNTSYDFYDVPTGTYGVSIRSVDIYGRKSVALNRSFVVTNNFADVLNRFPEGVPSGGHGSDAITIDVSSAGSETLGFLENTYGFSPPQTGSVLIENTSNTTTTFRQDISGIPQINWGPGDYSNSFIRDHFYLALDSSDATDRLKLLQYQSTADGPRYWYDAGDGSNHPISAGLTNLTGTITKVQDSDILVGSGTQFTSEVEVGQLVTVRTNSNTEIGFFAYVTEVISDTQIRIDKGNPGHAIASTPLSTPNFKFDYSNDSILARVYKDTNGTFYYQSFVLIDVNLDPLQARETTIFRLNNNSINNAAGSFSDPLNGNTGWQLHPPSLTGDGDKVYQARRLFTADGTGQDPTWSPVTIYAQRQDGVTPAAPENSYVTVSTITKSTTGTYSASHLDADVVFKQGTTVVAKRRYRVTRSGDTWTTVTARDNDISDELNIGMLAATINVSGTQATLVVTFTGSGTTLSGLTGVASIPFNIFSEGAQGVSGATVSITSPTQVITYDKDGLNPSPSAQFTLTATATNSGSLPYYKWYNNGTNVSNVSGSQANPNQTTIGFTAGANITSLPAVIKVEVYESSTASTALASDTFTIFGIQPGETGEDAYSVILGNESHTLHKSNAGVVTYTGSGTTIRAFKGITELNSVSGTPGTGQFKVTATGTNITPGSPIGVSGTPAVVPIHNSMTANTASVTYSVNLENVHTADRIQSLTISEEGPAGLDAYTITLSNESHSLFTTQAGVVTYTGSGTTIRVFKGSTELNSVSGTPGAGQFSVTAAGTNITPGSPIGVSGNPAVVPIHSAMNANNATVVYTINLEGTLTTTKEQTLTKAIEGTDGDDGDSISIIYKRSVTPPSTPSASSGTPFGWYNTIASANAATSGVLYQSVGIKSSGNTNFTWGVPTRVEATDGARGAGRWYIPVTAFPGPNSDIRSTSSLTSGQIQPYDIHTGFSQVTGASFGSMSPSSFAAGVLGTAAVDITRVFHSDFSSDNVYLDFDGAAALWGTMSVDDHAFKRTDASYFSSTHTYRWTVTSGPQGGVFDSAGSSHTIRFWTGAYTDATLPAASTTMDSIWSSWADKPSTNPVEGDQAILFTGTATNHTAQEAYIYDGSSWNEQLEFIDGDLLVAGTITGDKISAGEITADKFSGDVTDTYPFMMYNRDLNPPIGTAQPNNASLALTHAFKIPAPSGGVSKRQAIQITALFELDNPTTSERVAYLRPGIYKKSRGVAGSQDWIEITHIGSLSINAQSAPKVANNHSFEIASGSSKPLSIAGGGFVLAGTNSGNIGTAGGKITEIYQLPNGNTYIAYSTSDPTFTIANNSQVYYHPDGNISVGTHHLVGSEIDVRMRANSNGNSGDVTTATYVFNLTLGQVDSAEEYSIRATYQSTNSWMNGMTTTPLKIISLEGQMFNLS